MRELILLRAHYHEKVRAFFKKRGSVEVDAPILQSYSSVDGYIDPFETIGETRYLHTSPEYAMKRMLSEGSGDIFYLGHVFRKEEAGSQHSPEFTMAEWYKTHTDEKTFLKEIGDFIELFVGPLERNFFSYDDAFRHFTNLYSSPEDDGERHYIWAHEVEPNFPKDKITIISDFPVSDAANAKIAKNTSGEFRAGRFEFYIGDVELANAFDELYCPEEQKQRFENENAKRRALGKELLEIDPALIRALEIGLPPNTYGVAAGFDRLLMLSQKQEKIADVIFR